MTSGFTEALRQITRRVPETELAMVMGIDGIPVEKISTRDDPALETVATQFTTLLRASVSAADDTGLGELTELAVVTDRMITLLMGITPEYFLFGAFSPATEVGRARFALRVAALALREEFE